MAPPSSPPPSGPVAVKLYHHHLLLARTTTSTLGQGTINPENIPNTVIFIVFGLIGAGLVCTAIWFFFRAKNGGFVFREGDWEDYKSTVLRRKGPNGTTLSGGSVATDLGGGSIVGRRQRVARYEKRYKDVDMDSSIGTSSEMNAIKSADKKEKANKSKDKKKTRSKSKTQMEKRILVPVEADDDDDDATTVVSLQPTEAIRAYRHEKPARVGGMNSDVEEALLSNKNTAAARRPTISKGLRAVQPSVYRTKRQEAEAERIRAEARKLQEKGRAAAGKGHRIFSYEDREEDEESSIGLTASIDAGREERRKRRERRSSQSPEKRIPGSWRGSDVGSEVSDLTGTKSYHHPLPGLSGEDVEERRKARRERRG